MVKRGSTPTRVTADVAATAAAVAPTENRTTTEQINYWVRIGMNVERSASVASRRILAVAAGDEQFSTLEADERVVAHATIDARIAERAAEQRFGPAARKAGQITVSIDDDGTLIEIAPDGSRRPL
ncbi:MAG: hypothetical protein V3V01_10680 [Acidimicrobiales bacterium]